MQRTLAARPNSLQINNLLFEAAHKGCAASLDDAGQRGGVAAGARWTAATRRSAIAAMAGGLPVVEALLGDGLAQRGRAIDIPDVVGSTPLIVAALADRNPVAIGLMEAGANVNAANRQGETALSIAAYNGNVELAGALIAHHARPDTGRCHRQGRDLLRRRTRGGSGGREALDAGVDPNARYRGDLTALMWAAGHADNAPLDGGLRTVKLLLARGAKVDFVDDRGLSALMIAAGLGHAEIARR